jgi:hypothetical protein
MLTGANFSRNHSETVLAFAGAKKENRLLAKAFGVDKAAFHPV